MKLKASLLKKSSLILAALLVVLGVLSLVYLRYRNGAFVVRANDGMAELRIPKDAVLEGGTINDITMTAVAPGDFFKESDQPNDPVRIYRLEPSGLKFSKPATVSITSPHDPSIGHSPAFLTFSGEERKAEILDIKDFRLDEDRGTFTVSGALLHFSDLLFIDRYIFVAQYIPKENITATVGQSFDVTHVIAPKKVEQLSRIVIDLDTGEPRYQVTTRDMENEYRAEERNFTIVTTEVRNGTRWKLEKPSSTIYTAGVTAPNEVVLETADRGAAEEYRITTRFTCVKAGTDRLYFRATPMYYPQQTVTHVRGGKPEEPVIMHVGGERVGVVELRGPNVDCVAPPPGAAPSSLDATKDAEDPATTAPTSPIPATSGGKIKVCGLPGGEPCPKR